MFVGKLVGVLRVTTLQFALEGHFKISSRETACQQGLTWVRLFVISSVFVSKDCSKFHAVALRSSHPHHVFLNPCREQEQLRVLIPRLILWPFLLPFNGSFCPKHLPAGA